MTKDNALATIQDLDGYFVDCEDIGQGINSKESIGMVKAMDVAMAEGVSPLTIDAMIASETSHCILARSDVVSGMRKLFA